MNNKDLYEEDDLNEEVESENDDDEIIENDDEFEETVVKEDKNPKSPKPQTSPKNPPQTLNQESKEDVLNFLLQNPVQSFDNDEELFKKDEQDNKESKPISPRSKFNPIPEVDEVDFDTALNKMIAKMSKENDLTDNPELYDVLLNDRDLIEEKKKIQGKNIAQRADDFLSRKEQKIKKLEEKLNDEFNKNYTFAPATNTAKINPNVSHISAKKRGLNDFLQDQENYQKKLQEKLSNLKNSQDKKAVSELKSKPQICQTSKKLASEKYKGEEVYNRLYNQKETIKIEKGNPKSEKKTLERNKEKKKSISSIATESNNSNERFAELYNEAMKRQEKMKEKETLSNKQIKESGTIKTNTNSNKFLYKKFKNIFKEQISIILKSNSEIKFFYEQLFTLFTGLKFLTNLPNKKADEEKLLKEIYDQIKDENGQVKIDHIFIFCLSILNLYEYYIVTNYNNAFNTSESQKTLTTAQSSKVISKNPSVNNVAPIETNIVPKINAELQSRIKVNKKYGGFDCDGNYIILLSQAKLIFKDFYSFYQNYSNPPKPQPIQTEQNKKKGNQSKKSSMKRIEQLYQESAKKNIYIEKESEKYHKEKEEKELKLCTFKPKINTFGYKANVVPVENSVATQEQRLEMLYKKGTENRLGKKDKTTDDIELEKYKSECTFKPNIHEVNYEIFEKKNSIYNDEDLAKFNKRLQRGREEKEYRESIFERGEFLIRQRNKSDNKLFKKRNEENSMNVSNQRSSSKKRSFVESNSKLNNLITPIKRKKKHTSDEKPLLEIDVNLKHGVKRKLLVYDGDTAEELAEDFSEENNLDSKMKKKLELLIQRELDKLLMKIAEETGSSMQTVVNENQ